MVSKARDDFPEPLTPVTTVMASCGISTLIFLRLWTRAPRTRMDSCSGRTSVVAWVISFVAKGKPRQRVSSVQPKLQIIRLLSKRGKRRICTANSRFLGEGDLPDSAFHFQVNRRGGFSVSVVGVGVPVVLQAVHVDRADAAGRMSNNADVFRKTNVGLPHAPFNVGRQIRFAVASQVDVHLARPEIEIQPGERNILKMQISVSRAHIHFQLQRDVLAEMQIPIVLRTTEVNGVGILGDVELADAAVHVVIHARLVEGIAVGKIRVENVTRAAVDGELSRTHFQPGVRRLCSLQVHGLRVVLRSGIEAVAAGIAASVPEENDQDEDKRDRTNSGADGNSRRGVGIAASLHVIPDFSDADKNENERPVGPENRHGIETRMPIAEEKKSADRNEYDRKDEGTSPGIAVLGHGTPPLSCTTHAKGE